MGDVIKRLVNGVVILLALVALFTVPFGKRTLAQHARAIFRTPPAREAAAAVRTFARDVADRVVAEVEEARDGRPHVSETTKPR
jgi:hypothetical protein